MKVRTMRDGLRKNAGLNNYGMNAQILIHMPCTTATGEMAGETSKCLSN